MRTPIRIAILAAGALGAASIIRARRREKLMLEQAGSPTNASDVEQPQVRADADADEVLDVAVEQTFPASDPISIDSAYRNRT